MEFKQQMSVVLSLIVFPNPGKGVYELKLNGITEVTEYTVMNVTGAVVRSGKLNPETTQLDLTECANGFYYVALTINKQMLTFKLIKE